MGISSLTNNNAKISAGKDLVKIRPGVAEQSRQKIKKKEQKQNKNTERVVKHKTAPCIIDSFGGCITTFLPR